jgi:hypothetical protein
MRTYISSPTKNQVIWICLITMFCFLRVLISTDFLTNENLTNRQYLIYGILTLLGFGNVIAAILFYHLRKINSHF